MRRLIQRTAPALNDALPSWADHACEMSKKCQIPKIQKITTMKTILSILTLAALSTGAFAGEACKKCCADKGKSCATCCKDVGKKCGKDCCKVE
jgi:hypothetical protein